MERMFSVKEVAEFFQTNQNKVLGWIDSRELPAINIANKKDGSKPRWRISKSDLDTFVESRRTGSVAKLERKRPPKPKPVFFP